MKLDPGRPQPGAVGLVLLLAAAILLLLSGLVPVQAQDGLQLGASAVDVDFPGSLTFRLEARGPSSITRIELRYQVVGNMQCGPALSTATPEFSPAPEVKASWTWDMRKTGGLPPGAAIEYSWLLEDSQGRRLETPAALAQFADRRYSWQRLEAPGITLLWYRGSQGFARQLLGAAQQALEKLAQDTGVRPTRPVTLNIYGTPEELRGALIFPQEWTGGIAFTGYGIVAIGVPPELLEWGKRAVAHELTHLVVGELTFNCFGDIPVWLAEGLAMYAEGDLNPSNRSAFQQAVAQDRLLSVKSLSSGFPASPQEATLAYAESFQLVEFLLNHGGREKLLALLLVFKEGVSYDTALGRAYGWDTVGLDNAWRASLGLPPRPTPTPARQTLPLPTLVPFGATPPGAPPTSIPTQSPTALPSPAAPATPAPTSAPTPAPGGCRASGRPASTADLAWLAVALLPGAELAMRARGRRKGSQR